MEKYKETDVAIKEAKADCENFLTAILIKSGKQSMRPMPGSVFWSLLPAGFSFLFESPVDFGKNVRQDQQHERQNSNLSE